MKSFKQFIDENKEQETIKKYVRKKRKEGNAKAAAYRKLYAKLGYKGNPGNYDLEESRMSSLKAAAGEAIKDKVALGLIAAPIPGSAPAGIARMAYKTYRKYKENRKKELATA